MASISALTTKFSLSISAVVTDVARISQTVSVVIAKVTSISAVLTAYSLSISAVVTDVARISLSVSAVVTDMARVSQTVSVVIARVATMSSSVATAQTDIARISVTVSAIWTRINTLSASVSLIQATILGGTYTPTVTGKTNITSVDAVVVSQYIRAGSQVFVSGRFTALELALHAHVIPRYHDEPAEFRTGHPWDYDWAAAPPFDAERHREPRDRIHAALGRAA